MESRSYDRLQVVAPIDGTAEVYTGGDTDIVTIADAGSVAIGDRVNLRVRHHYEIRYARVTADGVQAIDRAFAEWAQRRDSTRPVGPDEVTQFHARIRQVIADHAAAGPTRSGPEVRVVPTDAVSVVVDAQSVSVGDRNTVERVERAVVDATELDLFTLVRRDDTLVRDMFDSLRAGVDPLPGLELAIEASLRRFSRGELPDLFPGRGTLGAGPGPETVRGPASVAFGDGNTVLASVHVARIGGVDLDPAARLTSPPVLRTIGADDRVALEAAVTRSPAELRELLAHALPAHARELLDDETAAALTDVAERIGLRRDTFTAAVRPENPGWDDAQLAEIRESLLAARELTEDLLDELCIRLEPPTPTPTPPAPRVPPSVPGPSASPWEWGPSPVADPSWRRPPPPPPPARREPFEPDDPPGPAFPYLPGP